MASEDGACWYRAVVDSEDPETAAALLGGVENCRGVEVVDDEVVAESQLEANFEAGTVVAYVERDSPEAAQDVRRRVTEALEPLADSDRSVRECERYTDDSWKERWKEYFEPVRLSPRVAVGPPWRADEIPDLGAESHLVVEPGMAFGTGQHATTELSARLLDAALARRDDPPDVLDVGCGSGILAMAAARLDASEVVGIDTDPDAIEAARTNLNRNDLADLVEVSTTPIADLERSFDIVVANILDSVLVELRDDLLARTRRGGSLIVSGIADDRIDDFLETFADSRLKVVRREHADEWYALACTPTTDAQSTY